MAARSKQARKRQRGGKPTFVKNPIVESAPENENMDRFLDDRLYTPTRNKLLWVAILLVWSWMFSYAPVYMGLQAVWQVQACQFISFICVDGIVIWAFMSYVTQVQRADPEMVIFFVLPMLIFCLVGFYYFAGGSAPIKPDEQGTRIVCFIGALLVIGVTIYLIPMIISSCAYKIKLSVKIFTTKNIIAFILAILTALTVIFQFLQVIWPMFIAHH